MVKTRAVQVRVTREQHERIIDRARARGFASLAAYVRYVALDQDFDLHQKICELHHHLIGGDNEAARRGPAAMKYRVRS